MSKKAGSAFDALLESFGTDEDRDLFQSLAEKNPAVREFGLRQDDYSRKLDAHSAELDELQNWRQWRESNWDSAHKMTRAEKLKQDRLDALETEKAELETRLGAMEFGESEMKLEDVEKIALDAMKKNGIDPDRFVSADSLTGKEKEVKDFVLGLNAYTAKASILVPYLNQQHKDEFGSYFDPEEFLAKANEAKTVDLKDFYQRYTAETRMQRMQADADAKVATANKQRDDGIAAERARVDAITEKMKGMGAQGTNPADAEPPQMGPLQRRLLGLDKKDDSGSGAPEVPLGEGAIAAHAAREFINHAAGR